MAAMATAAAKRLCHGAAPRRAVASAWNACGHGVRHHSTSGEELGMRAPPPSLKGRHLSSVYSLSAEEFRGLLDTAADLRRTLRSPDGPRRDFTPLRGDSLGMIFQKLSTRTRVSSETGMAMLGGHAIMLGADQIQLGVNESLQDTAKVLSGFNTMLLARVFGHEDIDTLIEHGSVPIINALSDLHHPLQAFADYQTLQSRFGDLSGMTITWIGDGTNVLHDLMMAAPYMGCNIHVATPPGYEANEGLIEATKDKAAAANTEVLITHDPKEALHGANVVVTDTWVSMGQEDEYAARLKAFEGYQVTNKMMADAGAADDWVFMHCLPRHEYEVDDEVFYGPRSLVWDEAENRMWTVMALMCALTGKF